MAQVDDERLAEYRDLAASLLQLRQEMLAAASDRTARLEQLHPDYLESGRNLLHYLVLRSSDLRPLQSRLAALGLSSLGRAESHVLATLESVLQALHELAGEPPPPPALPLALGYHDGRRLLVSHTEDLLNHRPDRRDVRIMVTMPTEAADDYQLVHNLLDQGMDCMRVNCAHDDAAVWGRMIANLDRARKELDKPCRVEMDLGGPKLRTGPLPAEPSVKRIRPQRDNLGRVTHPARIWLSNSEQPRPPPSCADAELLVAPDWLALLQVGDTVQIEDTRASQRKWKVLDVTGAGGGAWLQCAKTTYLQPGSTLQLQRPGKPCTELQPFPGPEGALVLRPGDTLIITRDQRTGRPASLDSSGQVLTPASIGCTLPEVFEHALPGQPVLFDDGRIASVIEKIDDRQVEVLITRTAPGGTKLRAGKGVNLPESDITLAALTDKDIQDLAFVVEHADIVGLSFTNSAADVELLHQHIERLGERRPGIVLKIETRRAFANLPSILITAMRGPHFGIMIARGDLAVECGFERLAEAQEEILWLSEAAHTPVIWATQVLENLAKEGMPSRAEITDAAMGDRAECVMLNKGPHILSAVATLDDILQRMQSHQTKKQSMLRELQVAHLLQPGNAAS